MRANAGWPLATWPSWANTATGCIKKLGARRAIWASSACSPSAACRSVADAFGAGGETFADMESLVRRMQDLLNPTCLPGQGFALSHMEQLVDRLQAAECRHADVAVRTCAGPRYCAVRVHHVPYHRGRADRAGGFAGGGPAVHSLSDRAQARPADPRSRSAHAFRQGRHADHGWRADSGLGAGLDRAVGRSGQPLRLERAFRDRGVRRHRIRRRFSQAQVQRFGRPECRGQVRAAIAGCDHGRQSFCMPAPTCRGQRPCCCRFSRM